jgi:hypothetical protein
MKAFTKTLLTALTICLLPGCEKEEPEVICNDPASLTYKKPIACTYLKDRLLKKGAFLVEVVEFPPSSTEKGKIYSMDIRPAGPDHNTIKLYWKTAVVSPSEFAVTLSGDSFTVSPAKQSIRWLSLVDIEGSGRFRNDSFFFNGITHSLWGHDDSYIILKGY